MSVALPSNWDRWGAGDDLGTLNHELQLPALGRAAAHPRHDRRAGESGRDLLTGAYLPWRRTISVIQIGANGDVQFGGVG